MIKKIKTISGNDFFIKDAFSLWGQFNAKFDANQKREKALAILEETIQFFGKQSNEQILFCNNLFLIFFVFFFVCYVCL